MDSEHEGPSAPPTPGPVRRPPRQRFAGNEHLFDLTAEATHLRGEPGGAYDGHRQITLFRGGGIAIVLFDFEAGGWLKDHAADGFVTVQVLHGEIVMTTSEKEHRMPAGSLLVLAPGIRHDVQAVTESQMLLSVRLDPAEDDRD